MRKETVEMIEGIIYENYINNAKYEENWIMKVNLIEETQAVYDYLEEYGINFTDTEGIERSIMQDAPNKQELKQIMEENYGEVVINWIDHFKKEG